MIPVYIFNTAVNKKEDQPHPDAVLVEMAWKTESSLFGFCVEDEKEPGWVVNFPDAWALLNFVQKLGHRVLLCPPREGFDYWAIMYCSHYKDGGVGFKQK